MRSVELDKLYTIQRSLQEESASTKRIEQLGVQVYALNG